MSSSRDSHAVASELLDALAERLADPIAQRVVEMLRDRERDTRDEHWLDSRRAARYLGLSLASLHRLTAARRIPFHQDGPNCRCWFKRDELDAWRA